MKTNRNLLALVFAIASHIAVWAADTNGIQFFTGTWSQALEKAQEENKPIFVDFYATWCGPCKHMAKNVFTNAEVGTYFNANMISIQINAEAQESELVQRMMLEAYPTLVVFDPSGNVMARQVGALEVQPLLDFAKSSTNFDIIYKNYLADPTNFTHINAYLSAQSFRDKEKLDSISSAILSGLSDDQLRTREAWDILVAYSADYRSRAFSFVTKNAKWYLSNIKEEGAFQNGYCWFISAMIEKAAETKDIDLLKKATSDFLIMRKSCGTMKKPESYYREAFQIRYLAILRDSMYQQRILKFIQTHHRDEWKTLASNALFILNNDPQNNSTKQAAIQMAFKARTLNNSAYTDWVAAIAKNAEGKTTEAKQLALQAFQKTKPGELLIDPAGSVSINLKTLDETAISIPLRVSDLSPR